MSSSNDVILFVDKLNTVRRGYLLKMPGESDLSVMALWPNRRRVILGDRLFGTSVSRQWVQLAISPVILQQSAPPAVDHGEKSRVLPLDVCTGGGSFSSQSEHSGGPGWLLDSPFRVEWVERWDNLRPISSVSSLRVCSLSVWCAWSTAPLSAMCLSISIDSTLRAFVSAKMPIWRHVRIKARDFILRRQIPSIIAMVLSSLLTR